MTHRRQKGVVFFFLINPHQPVKPICTITAVVLALQLWTSSAMSIFCQHLFIKCSQFASPHLVASGDGLVTDNKRKLFLWYSIYLSLRVSSPLVSGLAVVPFLRCSGAGQEEHSLVTTMSCWWWSKWLCRCLVIRFVKSSPIKLIASDGLGYGCNGGDHNGHKCDGKRVDPQNHRWTITVN